MRNEIRVLRAEAIALRALSDERCEAAKGLKSVEGVAISLILIDLASAKTRAADALEAEDRAREDKLNGAIGEG